jgi:endonuclease/exonuclease/phosphatase family metal-dependent hydrolase
MSSNIWGDYFGNPVELREEQLGRVFALYSPDILAMQEATRSWNSSKLFSKLRENYVFVETNEAPENNFLPLIYKRENFDCIDSGFVKFIDTPDPSKGATWAMLSDKTTGKRLAVICTHFWWKKISDPEMDAIRVSNARLITEKATEIIDKYSVPVIALGDLNSNLKIPSIAYLRESGWKFARDEAVITSEVCTHHCDPVLGTDGKYHGKRIFSSYQNSIDHIIYRGNIKPELFEVVEDQDALDVSDHSPVWCNFIIL